MGCVKLTLFIVGSLSTTPRADKKNRVAAVIRREYDAAVNEFGGALEVSAAVLPDFALWKTGKECHPKDNTKHETDLGNQSSPSACRHACVGRGGDSCNYFAFGKGDKAGSCWWEHDEACDSGKVQTDSYDVYKRASYMGVKFSLVKRDSECLSPDEDMGTKVWVNDCANAVRRDGGHFFVFGKGAKEGSCYKEDTVSEDCKEGWETDEFDFYKIETNATAQQVLFTFPLSDRQLCNYEFPLGDDDTNNCTRTDAVHVKDERLCWEVAKRSGAMDKPERLAGELFNHPEGCFRKRCGKDKKDKACYFFNTRNADRYPFPIDGTPVCSRPRFVNGTRDGHGGCPDGYDVIANQTHCFMAAGCLGYSNGTMPELLGEHGQFRDFPERCFIGDRSVYYNPAQTTDTQASVKGTPLCMHFPHSHFASGGV